MTHPVIFLRRSWHNRTFRLHLSSTEPGPSTIKQAQICSHHLRRVVEQRHSRMCARVTLDRVERDILRIRCALTFRLDQEVKAQMSSKRLAVRSRKGSRERQHSLREWRLRGKSDIVHQQLEAGRRDKDLDLAANHQGVRAVFAAGDELLCNPWICLGGVDAGGVFFRFGVGGEGEEGHVSAVGIVHGDSLQDILYPLDLCIREDIAQLGAGSDDVSFRDGETESLGALDKSVFFVQHGRSSDVVLNSFARRLSFNSFLCFAITDSASYPGTADPEVDVFALDDAQKTGYVAC